MRRTDIDISKERLGAGFIPGDGGRGACGKASVYNVLRVLLQICSVSLRGDASALFFPHPLDIPATLDVNRSVPEDLEHHPVGSNNLSKQGVD